MWRQSDKKGVHVKVNNFCIRNQVHLLRQKYAVSVVAICYDFRHYFQILYFVLYNRIRLYKSKLTIRINGGKNSYQLTAISHF